MIHFNARLVRNRVSLTRNRFSLTQNFLIFYIRVCFSLIFLPIWRICFNSGPLPMIFVATTYSFTLVNLKQLPMFLTPFLLSAKQWNALPDFFRTSFLADF